MMIQTSARPSPYTATDSPLVSIGSSRGLGAVCQGRVSCPLSAVHGHPVPCITGEYAVETPRSLTCNSTLRRLERDCCLNSFLENHWFVCLSSVLSDDSLEPVSEALMDHHWAVCRCCLSCQVHGYWFDSARLVQSIVLAL